MRPCWSAPVGSEELSRWSDFQGLYHQMYDDTFVVDETAICERVLQWPEFWDEEKEELIFSLEDCETFADTNTLTYFVNTHLLSKTDADYWMGVVQNRYNSEKVLWQKEYDLKRTLSFSNIWTDGDGGGEETPKKRTSPVDLVVSWNEIDKILFGVIAEYPEYASFSESEEDIKISWSEEPEEDEWLDQRGDKKGPYGVDQKHYKDGEESLSGGYAEQIVIFEEDLNTNSLIPGRATTQTFDMPFSGKPIPPSTGMHVDADATPAESTDDPLQISVLEQKPMGELEGAFSKLFQQQSLAELRDAREDGSRFNWLYKVFVTDQNALDQGFFGNIASLVQIRSDIRNKDIARLDVLPVQKFVTVIDVWISVLEKWKKVNEVFLTNDVK